MNSLTRKIAELLPELEARGPVYLFAFVERADVNLWDVVISSKWADGDMVDPVRIIAAALVARLDPQEMVMLSRIVPVSSKEPSVQEIITSLGDVTPKDEKVVYLEFLGLEVRRAFILRSQRPPATSPDEALIEAGGAHC